MMEAPVVVRVDGSWIPDDWKWTSVGRGDDPGVDHGFGRDPAAPEARIKVSGRRSNVESSAGAPRALWAMHGPWRPLPLASDSQPQAGLCSLHIVKT